MLFVFTIINIATKLSRAIRYKVIFKIHFEYTSLFSNFKLQHSREVNVDNTCHKTAQVISLTYMLS